MVIVCVEGGIGGGKTTLLDALEARGYHVYREATGEWTPWLERFHDDPKRWILPFQLRVLLSMRRQYEDMVALPTDSLVFCERSPVSNRIFADVALESGGMDEAEHALFLQLLQTLRWTPDIHMYLRTPVDVCLRRIAKRDRGTETTFVDREYLEALERHHDTAFPSLEMRVDGSGSPEAALQAALKVATTRSGVTTETLPPR